MGMLVFKTLPICFPVRSCCLRFSHECTVHHLRKGKLDQQNEVNDMFSDRAVREWRCMTYGDMVSQHWALACVSQSGQCVANVPQDTALWISETPLTITKCHCCMLTLQARTVQLVMTVLFFFWQSCFFKRYIPALSGRVKCFRWLILCRWHICIWLDAETLLRCPCHVRRRSYLFCSPCEMSHDLFYWWSLYLHIYLTSPLLHLFLGPALLCLCDVRG